MASKKTKNQEANSGGTTAESNATNVIDITKLTPSQLAALQKQLKEKSKEVRSKKDERFNIIDTMLKEKDDAGNFKHTTRDILANLVQENLVDTTDPEYVQREIKKIQARKQHLEKLTNEQGELVHPEGTFGYKPSEHVGFNLTPARVVEFFKDAANVEKMSDEQKDAVREALEG
jgi:hypothetical protein